MAKGSYPGGGTVIGPRDIGWFGTSGVENGMRPDAADVERRQAAPLTAQAERRITELRQNLTGLRRETSALDNALEAVRKKITGAETELAGLLHQHGLPLDPGLARPAQADLAASTKLNRAARRAHLQAKAKK